MNNLKLYSEASLNLQLHSPESDDVILFSAFDIEQSRLFFASSSNHIYSTHLSSLQHERAWSKTSIAANVTRIELDDAEDDVITSFVYLMEKESLLIGTSKGLLLLHNVDEDENNSMQVVGGVDGGVRCLRILFN